MINGTTQYYIELFKTNVMNGLIESETMTLSDQYKLYKNKIENLEESPDLKANYVENLTKAYDWIQQYLIGQKETLLLD